MQTNLPRFSKLCFVLLALLAPLCGWLLAQPSRIGLAGIQLFYKQYRFLTKPATATAAVGFAFMALTLLLFILWFRKQSAVLITSGLLGLFAVAGFLYSYADFTQDKSHRLLGWKFHSGVYLFWFGIFCLALSFLHGTLTKRKSQLRHPVV